MSKRTHSAEWEVPIEQKRDKNSLDSDEEDEESQDMKYSLQDDDIEGQEESGVTLEDGVQFTPFNMKEEMEEGHFDTNGMYHWNKEKNIRDNWLDNIDWVKVKDVKKDKDGDSDDDMPEAVNLVEIYKKIIPFLEPKETISRALKRLGGNKSLSASERLKMKKAGTPIPTASNEDITKVTLLTELANKILTHAGNMDIYQETFEQISDLISASSSKSKKEPELDMYADDFGVKEKERLEEPEKKDEVPKLEPVKNEETKETMWEFKRDMDSTKIEGPYSTQQMEKWAETGHFGKGVFVRRCGSAQFYNSNRIDFEIYF